MTCSRCGTIVAPHLLACPACHALVHAQELKAIAQTAESAMAAANFTEALVQWRRALELLPANAQQHSVIREKIDQLVRRVDAGVGADPSEKKPNWAKAGGILGAVALVLWKFKFLLVFVLTKAKLLLLGLTKASTFFSMIISLGAYWTLWGWKFALGVVLSIYVHEMGHVMMLRRYGIRATAPMFIPGLGAMIRLKQYPASAHEDARVGLAGPFWGLGAALASYLLSLATGQQIFAAIAKFGAWVNLFNLLPVFQLDGSHAFRALTKAERGGLAALLLLGWVFSQEGLLLLVGCVAAFRAFRPDAAPTRDLRIFIEFAVLVITLTILAGISVPTTPAEPLIAK